MSPSPLFICFDIVSNYLTVVQRSPLTVIRRKRTDPDGFCTISSIVPSTPLLRVVNCEPTVNVAILLPFDCLVDVMV